MRVQPDIEKLIKKIIRQFELPDAFARSAEDHFLPLISHLGREMATRGIRLVGINGAQGTGKSTLAYLIQQVLGIGAARHSVILSIDDVYLTRAERQELASRIHPLLRTRGVPGTHDVELLRSCLDGLGGLADGESMRIPRFDKSSDDRLPEESWELVNGPVDLVILEGWCVGSPPQRPEELLQPVNALEREQDASSVWRSYVNEKLQGPYADIFARIDYQIFLQAPDFESVYRWRLEQEQKLQAKHAAGDSLMTGDEILAFIQHYERLTRHNLRAVPALADVVLQLGRDHQCEASYYH